MEAAVVLGQDRAGIAGPVRIVRRQLWQRTTGSCRTMTGKREGLEVAIATHDASHTAA